MNDTEGRVRPARHVENTAYARINVPAMQAEVRRRQELEELDRAVGDLLLTSTPTRLGDRFTVGGPEMRRLLVLHTMAGPSD